nr:hypothetical protein [uncultured Desulfobacter sp.]
MKIKNFSNAEVGQINKNLIIEYYYTTTLFSAESDTLIFQVTAELIRLSRRRSTTMGKITSRYFPLTINVS